MKFRTQNLSKNILTGFLYTLIGLSAFGSSYASKCDDGTITIKSDSTKRVKIMAINTNGGTISDIQVGALVTKTGIVATVKTFLGATKGDIQVNTDPPSGNNVNLHYEFSAIVTFGGGCSVSTSTKNNNNTALIGVGEHKDHNIYFQIHNK